MSEHRGQTSAKDGWIILAVSLALWFTLLAIFLGVGHELAVSLFAAH